MSDLSSVGEVESTEGSLGVDVDLARERKSGGIGEDGEGDVGMLSQVLSLISHLLIRSHGG